MAKRNDNPIDERAKSKRVRMSSPTVRQEGSESSETTSTGTAYQSTDQIGEKPSTAGLLGADDMSSAIASGSGQVTVPEISSLPKNKKAKESVKSTKGPNMKSLSGVPTVQTIIPSPTTHVLDDIQMAGYEEDLRRRLQKLSLYVNESVNVYALAKLPPAATWGTYHPSNDHRDELCDPATNEPLTIWVLGHIISTWFARDGFPVKQAALTIVPLSAELGKQAAKLLTGLCTPITTVPNEHGVNLIRLTTWQSASNDDNCTLFENVYDATEALRSKQAMPQYDVLELQKDDLVLVECKLTRYRKKDGDNKGWVQRAQMELVAISLLHKGVDRVPTVHKECREIEDLCI